MLGFRLYECYRQKIAYIFCKDNCIGLPYGQDIINIIMERREVKIYVFNVYSFHHHRRFRPTSIRYLPVNRAARVFTIYPM